jgi:hypothetical protein
MPSQAEWSQRVALWKRSGQTAAATHGFSDKSLLWWSSTLRRDVPDGKPVAFAPLVAVPASSRAAAPQAFELVLRSGLVVRVPEGFDPRRLHALLDALEER